MQLLRRLFMRRGTTLDVPLWVAGRRWLFCVAVLTIGGMSSVRAVEPQFAIGDKYVLLLAADGTLWGWGDNTEGQIDPAAPREVLTEARRVPLPLGAGVWPVQVVAGGLSSFVLASDGQVYAPQSTQWERIEIGPQPQPRMIQLVVGSAPVIAGNAPRSRTHVFATLAADGAVYTLNRLWQQINPPRLAGPVGRLFGGTTIAALSGDGRTIHTITGAVTRLNLDLGSSHIVAATSDADFLYLQAANGSRFRYRLGSDQAIALGPLTFAPGIQATEMWGNDNHVLLRSSENRLFGFGATAFGELARVAPNPLLPQQAIAIELPGPVLVAAGSYGVSLALLTDGRVLAWGWSLDPRVAVKTFRTAEPMRVNAQAVAEANSRFVAVRAFEDLSAALDAAGNLYVWGTISTRGPNGFGSLSIPSPSRLSSPVAIREFAVGSSYIAAIGVNGQRYSWGRDHFGQVINDWRLMVPSTETRNWLKVASSTDVSIGSDAEGRIYQWLNNTSSVIEVNRGAIPTGVRISELALLRQTGIALGNNGIVYTWALFSDSGDLGRPTSTLLPAALPAPLAMPPNTLVKAIVGGFYEAFAVTDTGMAYTWPRSTSRESASLADFVSTAPTHPILASDRTHRLAYGSGQFFGDRFRAASASAYAGELGPDGQRLIGGPLTELPGLRLPGGIAPVALAAGNQYSLALGSDGDIYGWGSNATNGLGLITRASAETPGAMRTSSGSLDVCQGGEARSVVIARVMPAVIVQGLRFETDLEIRDGTGQPVCRSAPIDVALNVAGAGVTTDTGCTVPPGQSTCRVTGLVAIAPGSIALTASLGAVRATMNITVWAQIQNADIRSLPETVEFSAVYPTLPLVSSGGLPLTYTASGVCRLVEGRVELLSPGLCTLLITQAGATGIPPMIPTTLSIFVARRSHAITFPPQPDRGLVTTDVVTLNATSNRGLPITYRTDSSACSVSANRITLRSLGACQVTASQTGDATTLAAAEVTRSFQIVANRDAVPDAFVFVPVAAAMPARVIQSAPLTPLGFNVQVPISVTGAAYAINCTEQYEAMGTLEPGQSICVRLTSSPSFNQTVRATVTLGGVAGTFVVTTRPDPVIADPLGDADGDGLSNEEEAQLGLNPLRRDNDLLADTLLGRRLFVRQLYRDALGRDGEAAGIEFWVQQMAQGFTRAATAQAFIFSPESAQIEQPIARLFFATFRRVPDPTGLRFWSDQVRRGASLDIIADNFARSDEFIQQYGSLSDAEFVERLYLNVLNRPLDVAGAANWTAQLRTRTRGAVLADFAFSAEFRRTVDSDVTVALTYIALLARGAEPAGLAFWSDRVARGLGLSELILETLRSSEYRRRFLE
jgi:alpha-tubulin suppressor-like RCC1 family protein